MGARDGSKVPFKGFPDFRANVTFTPIQFFTVVIPHASRSAIRIVAFVLRQLLGWVDRDGNPIRSTLRCSYQDLIEKAGVSRDMIADAIEEALDRRYLVRVEAPAASEPGRAGRSGVYSLRWDMDGPLTHKPHDFQGFYFPPAALDAGPPDAPHPPRPRMARMNVPNAFFDHVIRIERLSVIRVVGALLFYSIGWGPGGERKRPVTKTVTDLSRLAHLARSKTHEALMAARASGYIEQVDRGRFTPGPEPHSTGSTYRIRWRHDDPTTESTARTTSEPRGLGSRSSRRDKLPKSRLTDRSVPISDRSEIGDPSPVGNGGSDRSETLTRDQSENGNALSLKEETKPETTTTEAVAVGVAWTPGHTPATETGSEATRLLREAGFDTATAQRLAAVASLEVIQRQVEWLPSRKASRNRLGLLRRAIEEDWARPEAPAPAPAAGLHPGAVEFTRHYYAAYHGFAGPAATEGFEADLVAASRFLPRILSLDPDEKHIPRWGARFGEFMRAKHQGDSRGRPNLSLNLVSYGDQLLRRIAGEAASRDQSRSTVIRLAHEARFTSAYIDYLRDQERRFQLEFAADYAAFLNYRARERDRRLNGVIQVPAAWLASMDREESRLFEFAAFFARHPRAPVLAFWEWDGRLNPNGLGRRSQQEVHA